MSRTCRREHQHRSGTHGGQAECLCSLLVDEGEEEVEIALGHAAKVERLLPVELGLQLRSAEEMQHKRKS